MVYVAAILLMHMEEEDMYMNTYGLQHEQLWDQ